MKTLCNLDKSIEVAEAEILVFVALKIEKIFNLSLRHAT